MGARSTVFAATAYRPDIPPAAHPDAMTIALFNRLRQHSRNCVAQGVMGYTPTTAGSQATGATGATVLNVNYDRGIVIVNGQAASIAAAADLSLWKDTVYTGDDAGAKTTTLTNGKSAIVTVVAASDSAVLGEGTTSLVQCHGATATTGAQVCCTDAEIQAKVGAGLPWVRLFDVTINRDGDTSMTQAQNNLLRPLFGITVDSDFLLWT